MVVVGVAVICGIVPDHEVPADGGRRLPPGRGTGPGRAGRSTIRGPADRRRSRARARAHRVVSLCKRSLEVYDPRRPATAGIAPRRGRVSGAPSWLPDHRAILTSTITPPCWSPSSCCSTMTSNEAPGASWGRSTTTTWAEASPVARGCRRSSGTLYLILRSEVRCP